MKFEFIKTYVWYDGPVLFLLKSEFEDDCIGMALEGDNCYIIFKLDKESIHKLEFEKEDLRSVLIDSPWCLAKYNDKYFIGEDFTEEKCDEENLPDSGFTLFEGN